MSLFVHKRKVATVQIENGGLSYRPVIIFLVKNHSELIKHSLKEVLLCVNDGLILCVLTCKGKINKCWVISQHCKITTPSNTGQFFCKIIQTITSMSSSSQSYIPTTLVPGDHFNLWIDECNIKSLHLIEDCSLVTSINNERCDRISINCFYCMNKCLSSSSVQNLWNKKPPL